MISLLNKPVNFDTLGFISRPLVSHPHLATVLLADVNKIRRQVKAADIKDNLDISRITDIFQRDVERLKRYKLAMNALGGRIN